MPQLRKYYFTAFLLAGLVACQTQTEKKNSETSEVSAQPTVTQVTDTIPAKMVWIPAGKFRMGSDDSNFPDAQPIHEVELSGFWMDEHEVTNAEFAQFVKATGYVTVAERALNPADFPGVPIDKLVPGSGVFTPPTQEVSLDNPLQWWQYVPGASWRHPQGPNSSITNKPNDPVVQVCYEDAAAYAKWAGKRLPTEA